jgi:hypothetical protein
MPPRSYGEVVFSLKKLQIASYNILTDVMGTPVDLPEAQKLEFAFIADNDQIKAEGALTHLLSVITHGTFKMSNAGLSFEALAAITGASNASSGTTPTRSRKFRTAAGGDGLPYFTIAGKMSAEGGADFHVGLAVCKLDTMPSWTFEQNKFVLSEMAGKCIQRSGGKVVYIDAHETATDINFTDLFSS